MMKWVISMAEVETLPAGHASTTSNDPAGDEATW